MDNKMTMINVEENNENNVEVIENDSTVGEKAAVVAVVAGLVVAVGAAAYGAKKLAGKIKNAWTNRKSKKKTLEAEFVELDEEKVESEEESD